MDSEKKRSDEYWMGVRDSLRMVDSFIKWARRNKDRAKTLDDFIHDGLVAAAKRCESCLKDDLGLSFAEDEERIDESSDIEHIPPGYEMASTEDESYSEENVDDGFDMTPDDMSPESSEVPIETEDDSISIDTVGRIEEEEIEDISIDGPTREFSSDFELIEPTDLDPKHTNIHEESVPPESEVESDTTGDAEHGPSFTWDDYERAITPARDEPEYSEEDIELPPPVEMESVGETFETETISEPPEISNDESETSTIDDEDVDASKKITQPPPPPPPPDSDEDEEERRRRARRLFFGD